MRRRSVWGHPEPDPAALSPPAPNSRGDEPRPPVLGETRGGTADIEPASPLQLRPWSPTGVCCPAPALVLPLEQRTALEGCLQIGGGSQSPAGGHTGYDRRVALLKLGALIREVSAHHCRGRPHVLFGTCP